MNAFHAYDIRGIYNKDFNKDDVYKIGFFLPELLQTNKILVGRDVRKSTPEIFEYLCKGINDAGADVYDLGISTTPLVYFVTAKHGFAASVQITASHNPKEYNGLKISREQAKPVGFDNGLGQLKEMTETRQIVPKEDKGSIIDFDKRNEYLDFLRPYVPDTSNLRVAIDLSNGMAGLFIRDLLGDTPFYLYEKPDGDFPNHEANPLDQNNLVDLKRLVIQESCDLGVIFDGDGDRVMFIDETGHFISPDLMIAVLSEYFFEKYPENKVVLQDIRTSKAVSEYIERKGGKMHTWRVGRAYAALKLRELDAQFGGELAGHYYFKDFYYSDSGLLAAMLILDIVGQYKRQDVALSQVIDKIAKYKNSGEINFKIQQKLEAMEAVKNHLFKKEQPDAFFDFDGYRIEYPQWWLSIRPSNTEPYLRLLVEAKSSDLLQQKVDEIKGIIQSFS